jgi:GGDEF domain-containing protein
MRNTVVKLGRVKTIIITTLISVFLSVVITTLALYIFNLISISLNTFIGLLIAITAPLIVAPSLSWLLTGLIFKIHKLEEEMRLLATYDSLTGLLSRRAFIEQTNYICHFAERQGLEFTILLIDLDYFKKINDRYGHAAGDKVLESFGKSMRKISRESDMVGRLGGEVIKWNSASISYTTSIGLAFFSQTVNNIEKALSLADKALYSAKKKGRNQTVIYNADLES